MDTGQHQDISERKIAFNYWLITNLEQIKKFGIVVLIIFNGVLWLYSLWGLISLAIYWSGDQSALNKQLVSQPMISQVINKKPIELTINEPTVLSATNGKYDVVSKVINANSDWGVNRLTYYFNTSAGATPTTTITMGPSQSTYLSALGIESKRRVMDVELIIVERSWQKISPDLKLNDFNLTAEEPVYTSSGNGRKWVTFTAKNNTLQNYWRVNWQVALYNGSILVGFNSYDTDQLEALTSRQAEVGWLENIPGVTNVEVLPYINIFDQSINYVVPGKAKDNY